MLGKHCTNWATSQIQLSGLFVTGLTNPRLASNSSSSCLYLSSAVTTDMHHHAQLGNLEIILFDHLSSQMGKLGPRGENGVRLQTPK